MNKATMQMVQDYLRKIKELEKENAELKHNKKTVAHLAYCLEEKMNEQIIELKKRNAELKGMYAHSAREAETYRQFLEMKEKENVELKNKSKDLIKQLMYASIDCIAWYCLCDKAKQFLKEIEK